MIYIGVKSMKLEELSYLFLYILMQKLNHSSD